MVWEMFGVGGDLNFASTAGLGWHGYGFRGPLRSKFAHCRHAIKQTHALEVQFTEFMTDQT
eukprot:3889242-Amphidinium_carterae.1